MAKRGLEPARRHAKKADSLWRRHKTRAAFFACLALAELTAWAARQCAIRVHAAACGLLRRYELEVRWR